MKFQVLMSCMYQKDTSIVQRSNIQSDAIIINQCDCNSIEEFDFINNIGRKCHILFVSTTERGLARSRNMAIKYASADICLIADDDELFCDNYENEIISSFEKYDKCHLIAFKVTREGKIYPDHSKSIGFLNALKIGSWQICFKLNFIKNKNIIFDILMGSGSGNGASEETKFLFDILRKKGKIQYCPITIASVKQENSQWFDGFTKEYFFYQGWAQGRVFGNKIIALIYLLSFIVRHSSKIFNKVSRIEAFQLQIKGLFLKCEPYIYQKEAKI